MVTRRLLAMATRWVGERADAAFMPVEAVRQLAAPQAPQTN